MKELWGVLAGFALWVLGVAALFALTIGVILALVVVVGDSSGDNSAPAQAEPLSPRQREAERQDFYLRPSDVQRRARQWLLDRLGLGLRRRVYLGVYPGSPTCGSRSPLDAENPALAGLS